MAAAARRYSVLMTSLFRVTEQGMGSYEVLSRASAFPVRLQDSEDSPVHWLGSQHVVRPFRYTKYYPPEQHAWLSEVQDYHIRVKLQVVHNSTGAILVEADASPTMYHHPERDVSCLGLDADDDDAAASTLQQFMDHGVEVLTLGKEAIDETSTVPLLFSGHNFVDDTQADEGTAAQVPEASTGHVVDHMVARPAPRAVPGHVLIHLPLQTFCHTDTPLAMGMCGGPVVVEAATASTPTQPATHSATCVGLVEGIVPKQPEGSPAAAVEGCASCIEAPLLRAFLEEVESRQAEPVIHASTAD